ncbi:hypothetical protein BDV96DRAFT_241421 [Lophiotrema nucula]|uniref:Uncharacterized protein n=1 Tax=Lophiotrema nucula TaxID=690887 RepID=A0A6A5YRY8_9PLEO|nr:hypothetical protein BDV96DRAFT_241421 [Lophiotrema nucula]
MQSVLDYCRRRPGNFPSHKLKNAPHIAISASSVTPWILVQAQRRLHAIYNERTSRQSKRCCRSSGRVGADENPLKWERIHDLPTWAVARRHGPSPVTAPEPRYQDQLQYERPVAILAQTHRKRSLRLLLEEDVDDTTNYGRPVFRNHTESEPGRSHRISLSIAFTTTETEPRHDVACPCRVPREGVVYRKTVKWSLSISQDSSE